MLKHCSPSSVDVRRHSRRNLHISDLDTSLSTLVPIDVTFDDDNLNNGECSSEKSFNTVSSNNDIIYENLIADQKTPSPNRLPTSPLRFGSTTVTIRQSPTPAMGYVPKYSQAVDPKMPIKVYASCLRSDIEYKTLSITYKTTSKELIWMLLSKYKMKHRDPKLFFLTMDINIRRTGIPLRRTLALDDESRPAELKSCHPWGECKFTLQMRKGGIVKIHDSVLMAESKYKCLLISEQTTVSEVIRILFHCYGLEATEKEEKFCLYEVATNLYERRLHPDEQPVQAQSLWSNQAQFRFVLRKIPEPSLKSTHPPWIQKESPECDNLVQEMEGRSNLQTTLQKTSPTPSMISLCSEVEEIEEVVTPVDHFDGGHFVNRDLDMSYSSGESEASSEFSALRFRDSPISSSNRSSASTDSGLLKSSPDSLPPFLRRHHNKMKKQLATLTSNNATVHICRPSRHDDIDKLESQPQISRHFSLHSLLETLPAASVDTGAIDGRAKQTSLSSLSTYSQTSDFDGYFYI